MQCLIGVSTAGLRSAVGHCACLCRSRVWSLCMSLQIKGLVTVHVTINQGVGHCACHCRSRGWSLCMSLQIKGLITVHVTADPGVASSNPSLATKLSWRLIKIASSFPFADSKIWVVISYWWKCALVLVNGLEDLAGPGKVSRLTDWQDMTLTLKAPVTTIVICFVICRLF